MILYWAEYHQDAAGFVLVVRDKLMWHVLSALVESESDGMFSGGNTCFRRSQRVKPAPGAQSLVLTSGGWTLPWPCDLSTWQSLSYVTVPSKVCQQQQVRVLAVNCRQWSPSVLNSSVLRVTCWRDVRWLSEFFCFLKLTKTFIQEREGWWAQINTEGWVKWSDADIDDMVD